MVATRLPHPPPIAELNTTPLIDVLLVLLILFVITIPPSVNSLELPLPQAVPNKAPLHAASNSVTVLPQGTIAWNGVTVTERELSALLVATRNLTPEPELRFEPDGQAPYNAAAQTLRIIKSSGVDALGLVGTERFAQFTKAAPR